MTITRVADLGNDLLEVRGYIDDPEKEIIAYGWVSAMSNHYADSAYGEDGHLLPDAVPKEMTDSEKTAYWMSLLEAQVPQETVLFDASQPSK